MLNPLHPVASGGFVGGDGSLTEDFTAITAGATYRADRWSVTGRAEYRAGDQGDRYGVTAAALRQIGEGSARRRRAQLVRRQGGRRRRDAHRQPPAVAGRTARPAAAGRGSRSSSCARTGSTGAVAGQPGPIGIPLTISGDARSRRIVNASSVNCHRAAGGSTAPKSRFSGARATSPRNTATEDVGGWSNVVGADFRFDLSDTIDVGVAGTVRGGLDGDGFAWSAGPSIGFTPFENGWLSVGWNVAGFHDRDFEEARYTRNGPYVTMRFKFDQMSLAGLGLGGR